MLERQCEYCTTTAAKVFLEFDCYEYEQVLEICSDVTRHLYTLGGGGDGLRLEQEKSFARSDETVNNVLVHVINYY